MNAARVLFVGHASSDEKLLKQALDVYYVVDYCSLGKEMTSHLSKSEYQIVLLSPHPLEKHGSLDPLKEVQRVSPSTPVIVLSKSEETPLIVKAVKAGAFDFIAEPFSNEKILYAIERALENRRLKNEIAYLRHEQNIIYDFDAIVSNSPAMKETISALKKFSQTDSTILLTGETGTGKSFLSGAIHFNSHRRKRGFIKINCANIPDTLLESELFGHEKGAFTGANKIRMGRLEQGAGGTVLLDEIGEMNPGLQAKLLRVLEDKSFERLGGNKTIQTDVRIICATNRDPERQVEKGELREDLYYRINILRVHLPPLRERQECIEPLAHLLMERACRILKKRIEGFSSRALAALQGYNWPGNIRQLSNVIERAVILEESSSIQEQNISLPESLVTRGQSPSSSSFPSHTIRDQEKDMIVKALEQNLWVQKHAAKSLGITPRSLNYKVKKLGIRHPRWRKNK